jgi:hypothetical protein
MLPFLLAPSNLKKLQWSSKSRPIGEKSPNLVTLLTLLPMAQPKKNRFIRLKPDLLLLRFLLHRCESLVGFVETFGGNFRLRTMFYCRFQSGRDLFLRKCKKKKTLISQPAKPLINGTVRIRRLCIEYKTVLAR